MSYEPLNKIVEVTAGQRRTFFEYLFGRESEGYICIAFLHNETRRMEKHFFQYPQQLDEMLTMIDEKSAKLVHSYFCPNIYGTPGKKDKEYVTGCSNVWADLDTCDPKYLILKPSIIVQTSPGRYQAYWVLQDIAEPTVAEEVARRIAYYHSAQGADKSGWDLSQLMRIPYTPNLKYGKLGSSPMVNILYQQNHSLYRIGDFHKYPPVPSLSKITDTPMPVADETIEDIYSKYPGLRTSDFDESMNEVPEKGEWSDRLWRLEMHCFEQGLTASEVFQVAKASACNKYRRDNRPDNDLWNEVCRANIKHNERFNLAPTVTSTIPDLITDEEQALIRNRQSFVERYISWATIVTDAAPQYHQASAFMLLSALMAGNVKLPTSFGTIIPNLWFMTLGNTTLTRKSTAAGMALKLLYDIDENYLLATDASVEGLLAGMSTRPGESSIFVRDEFTGLLEAIGNRDYMAGFAEQLTKLYDGDALKRILRKETINIQEPIFIMYVSGIKTKTQHLVTEEMVSGGFIPRFIIISADPDPARIRPLGPPIEQGTEARDSIKNELLDIHAHYVKKSPVVRDSHVLGELKKEFKAELTPEAWKRYNAFEMLMLNTALDAGLDYLTPVYDRLAKSTLKAAILIAGSMQRSNKVLVDEIDILHAISYAKSWREYAQEIVTGIGKTHDERTLDRIYLYVRSKHPTGASRAELMTNFHLDAKQADLFFRTMEQRGMVYSENGKYHGYH